MAQFQKGKSGNPGGRSKRQKEVEDIAKEYSTQAIDKLALIAFHQDPADEDLKSSVSACNSLLDRGWGKPKQRVEAKITAGGDLAAALEAARRRARGEPS